MRVHAVPEALPPALLAGLVGELDQPAALILRDTVGLEQVAHIPRRYQHPPGLDPADLRRRAVQPRGDLVAGQSRGLAQAVELGSETATANHRLLLARGCSQLVMSRS